MNTLCWNQFSEPGSSKKPEPVVRFSQPCPIAEDANF
jgi:hypothetical protein